MDATSRRDRCFGPGTFGCRRAGSAGVKVIGHLPRPLEEPATPQEDDPHTDRHCGPWECHQIPTGTIDIGRHNLGRSHKLHNVQRDGQVTLVVDDSSIDPWAPRGIEIRGEAEALTDAEPPRPGFSSELIRIHPNRVLAWGLDSDALAPPLARNVEHG